MDDQKIMRKAFRAAVKARLKAYAPYSKFLVGASLTKGNQIFAGFNIENSSYGATLCAERTALAHALASGVKSFDSLTVITRGPRASAPCGLCLQMLSEFLKPNTKVFLGTPKGIQTGVKFRDLLPFQFDRRDLRP